MKFSSPRLPLLDSLLAVSRALSNRTALPALGGIMLEASVGPEGESGLLSFKATDSEMSLTCSCAAQVEIPGKQLLPGRLLIEVVKALPDGSVEFESRAEYRDVEVRAGSAQFHLRTLLAEDFPPLPIPAEDPIKLPAAAFAATIERVIVAASNDEVRPILTGILIQAEESNLVMVATDSYRLCVKQTTLDSPVVEVFEAVIPARALRELARLVDHDEPDGKIEISMLGSQIVFNLGEALLSSRLIDGQFPSYKQLIPEAFDYDLKLGREEFLEVAKRVRHLAQRQVPLKLTFSEGELEVAAETPDLGDARDALPVPFEGDPLEIAFNPKYLIEGIENVRGDEIFMKISSPLRPGLLVGTGDEEFRYLVMPIRLNV